MRHWGAEPQTAVLLCGHHQSADMERGREEPWRERREGWDDGNREGTHRNREEELQKALDRERNKVLLAECEISELRSRRASAEEHAAAWRTALELSEQRLHTEMENASLRMEMERRKQQENTQSAVERERAQVELYFRKREKSLVADVDSMREKVNRERAECTRLQGVVAEMDVVITEEKDKRVEAERVSEVERDKRVEVERGLEMERDKRVEVERVLERERDKRVEVERGLEMERDKRVETERGLEMEQGKGEAAEAARAQAVQQTKEVKARNCALKSKNKELERGLEEEKAQRAQGEGKLAEAEKALKDEQERAVALERERERERADAEKLEAERREQRGLVRQLTQEKKGVEKVLAEEKERHAATDRELMKERARAEKSEAEEREQRRRMRQLSQEKSKAEKALAEERSRRVQVERELEKAREKARELKPAKGSADGVVMGQKPKQDSRAMSADHKQDVRARLGRLPCTILSRRDGFEDSIATCTARPMRLRKHSCVRGLTAFSRYHSLLLYAGWYSEH